MMKDCETVTVSMPPAFKKKLTGAAKKLDVPRSVLIRRAVNEFLKTKPNKATFKRD